MRVTIDLDSKSVLRYLWTLFKGIILTRKLPEMIKESSGGRGYHFIWADLNITQERAYLYRRLIGDDVNRIALDKSSPKRVKQVLFNKKKVTFYNNLITRIKEIQ